MFKIISLTWYLMVVFGCQDTYSSNWLHFLSVSSISDACVSKTSLQGESDYQMRRLDCHGGILVMQGWKLFCLVHCEDDC